MKLLDRIRQAEQIVKMLAALILALVAVACVNGLHLSSDLTFGDLIVGAGTLALAGLTGRLAEITGKLAEATAAVDRRAAEREERRQEREARGIARLIDGELEVVQKSWEEADGAGVWYFFLQIPHSAWDGYAAVVLQDISPGDGLELIRFFNQLGAWETEVTVRYTDQTAPILTVVDSDWEEPFRALRQPLSNARRILQPLAYDGRESASVADPEAS